jgi:hypothetical protein
MTLLTLRYVSLNYYRFPTDLILHQISVYRLGHYTFSCHDSFDTEISVYRLDR